MNDAEKQIKHLEFIQNIVTRMNGNSFQIKSWTITIVSAIFAIYATNPNSYFILVSAFPVIMFWFLDAYYLQQERKFRGLYNDVAGVSEDPQTIKPFAMRPDLYVGAKHGFFNVFFSSTVMGLYASLGGIIIVIFVILKCFGK